LICTTDVLLNICVSNRQGSVQAAMSLLSGFFCGKP